MTLTQQTFLGASIRSFNGSIGWNNQSSSLTVNLVEDDTNGDSFDPPKVGSAVYFDYDNWQFGGLLQNYQREYSQQGNPVFSVQIKDPRDLLSGVQLILQDYTGSTYGVDNLYNIFGYLESSGFGGSQSNDSGIPWMLVRNAFYALQLQQPIFFRDSYYILDPFIGLDLLPSYYRIAGDNISALDFIQDICNAIACDFYVDMIPLNISDTSATNAIKVKLVSRNYALRNDAINTFVSQTEGAVAKNAGYELSNEITTKFVVGGKLNNIYFQSQHTQGTETLYDDIILPYWGYDSFGRLAIGEGDFSGPTGHEYRVRIDGRPLYLQTGKMSLVNYTIDLAELHAAKAGQESWEAFLWFFDDIKESIHYGKASALGLSSGKLSDEFKQWLKDWREGERPDGPKMPSVKLASVKADDQERNSIQNEEQRKRITKIYSHINRYATEYYGKKFMVRIPFVAGALVPESNIIRLSLTPTQTGYVEETYWGRAAFLGYMPYNPEKFTAQDNKLYSYVRFASMTPTQYEDEDGNTVITNLRSKYGFDKLPLDSYILDQYPNLKQGAMRENLFVKCQVDENLVFLNSNTLFSPRAVVTLDGPVTNATRGKEYHYTALLEEIKLWVKEKGHVSDEAAKEWADEFGTYFGTDYLWKAKDASFHIPDLAAIPLENHILRYGPWYIQNTSGRVQFETDEGLVPWKFGGFTAMNYAGWAKVEDALTIQQSHETGAIEYPGVPTLSLGSALLNAGPTITDVNVAVSEQGVTTTYRMATWSWRFGNIGKYNVERFARLSRVAQEQRKAFRQFYGYREPLNYYNSENKEADLEPEDNSNHMIVGDIISTGEDDDLKIVPSVVSAPIKTIIKGLKSTIYSSKAGISMDGLYVPFSSNTESSNGLPKFESPSEDAISPTSEDLKPFGSNSIGAVFPDGDNAENLDDTNETVKSIALRSPLIVGGWGWDTDGNRVPNHDNYKTRADLWKVGPLDIRWDNSRKVWSVPNVNSQWYLGKVNSNIEPSGNGYATRYAASGVVGHTEPWIQGSGVDAIHNPHGIVLPAGLKVRYTNQYVGWDVFVAEPFDYTECSGTT